MTKPTILIAIWVLAAIFALRFNAWLAGRRREWETSAREFDRMYRLASGESND